MVTLPGETQKDRYPDLILLLFLFHTSASIAQSQIKAKGQGSPADTVPNFNFSGHRVKIKKNRVDLEGQEENT